MKPSFFKILCGIIVISCVACGGDENPNGNVDLANKAYLFAGTADGKVKRYDINNGANKPTIEISSSTAVDIIAESENSFSVLSAEPKRIEFYEALSIPAKTGSIDAVPDFISNSSILAPTDFDKNEQYYVVSDTADIDADPTTSEGRFFIFTKEASGFQLRNMVLTDFRVMAIKFVGNDLFVTRVHSNKLSVFRNFLDSYKVFQKAVPDKTVAIEDAVQLSSLDYADGTMFLADVGNKELDGDGAIFIISEVQSKINNTPGGNIIPMVGLHKISGNKTQLGNPMSIDYNSAYNAIFVAENANSGGRVIAFNRGKTAEGNISPDLSYKLPAATSVDFYTE